MTTTVLVTNGLLNKSLAVIRSLGAKGVHVIASDHTRFHVCRFSKHTAQTLVYPNPKLQPENFYEWLLQTVKRKRIDLIIATDDDTLSVIVSHQAELLKYTRLVIPSEDSFNTATDKALTIRLAEKLGIPCPKTIYPSFSNGNSDIELSRIAHSLNFPVIIKPRKSSGSRGIKLVHTKEHLISLFKEIHEEEFPPLIQEWIPPGPKIDVCVLYDYRQQIMGTFTQKEIRNFPIPMGPSSACISINNPTVVCAAHQLLSKLKWTGLADVEFMIDPRDGIPKLMEVNPRLWSSLYFSIQCGIDFPWLLYQTAFDINYKPALEHSEGDIGRSILPYDLLHYLTNPKRHEMNPSFWNFKIHDELLSLKDPLPTVGFLFSVLRHSLSPTAYSFLFRGKK